MATIQPTPADFNPVRFSGVSYYVAMAYLGLTAWDSEGKDEPALAESWNISPDGLTVTFKLRDGLKWSDGQPLTSDDVAFTFKETTESGSWMYSLWTPITIPSSTTATGWTVRPGAIETPDPRTVIFHLSSAHAPFFPWAGGWPIIPKHYYEGIDLIKQNPDFSTIVASGPYVPRQYVPGDRIIFDANPNYYDGKPTQDRVIFRFYRDSTAAEIALVNGEAAYMADVPPSDARALSLYPNIQLGQEQNQVNIYLALNVYPTLADGSDNPLKDIKVRKAIAMSVDINAILNSSLSGYYMLANQIIVPNMYYLGKSMFNATIPSPPYPFNQAEAKRLLDDAGYPVRASGGRFSLSLLMRTGRWGSAGFVMMQLIQSSLAQVGIDVQVSILEASTFVQRVQRAPHPKDWSMALMSMSESPDADAPATHLACGLAVCGAGRFDVGGYNNTIVNELTLLGQKTTDADKRTAIYQRISGIVYEEVGLLELYYQTELFAFSKEYQGFTPGLGNPLYDYWGAIKHQSLAQVRISEVVTTSVATETSTTPTMQVTDFTGLIAGVILAVAAVGLVGLYLVRRRGNKKT
jgi:peptide/nickel transport system substrate-binding protein